MLTRIACVAAVCWSSSGLADTVTLRQPISTQSIETSDIAVVVYYTERSPYFRVVATYVRAEAPKQARRVRVALTDGDAVLVAVPGASGARIGFKRVGGSIIVSTRTEQQIAMVVK